MSKLINFEVQEITKFEKLNDGLLLAKCLVCTKDQVANGFNFTEQGLNDSLDKWGFLPTKGHFVRTDDNGFKDAGNSHGHFLGHNPFELDDEGNEIRFTEAYGCTMPYATYEDVLCQNGETKKYLTVPVVLWVDEYPEELQSFSNGFPLRQSMEVMIDSCEYDAETGTNMVKSFTPRSLCILGNKVSPAFKDSKIIPNANFSITKFQELVDKVKKLEIKFNKEGGSSMNYEELYNELKGRFETLEANLEEMSTKCTEYETQITDITAELEESRQKCTNYETQIAEIEGFIKKKRKKCEENDENGDEKFELSHDEIWKILHNELNPIDSDGYRSYNYWIVKTWDTYFVCESITDEGTFYRFDYSKDNDVITINAESKAEVVSTYITKEEMATLEAAKAQMQNELAEIKSKYEELETQYTEVSTKYAEKVSAEEMATKEELVGTFAELLTDSEVKAAIGEDLTKFTLEEIDTKLNIAVGKKSKAQFSKKPNAPEGPKVFTDFDMGSYSEFSKMAEEIRARKGL